MCKGIFIIKRTVPLCPKNIHAKSQGHGLGYILFECLTFFEEVEIISLPLCAKLIF